MTCLVCENNSVAFSAFYFVNLICRNQNPHGANISPQLWQTFKNTPNISKPTPNSSLQILLFPRYYDLISLSLKLINQINCTDCLLAIVVSNWIRLLGITLSHQAGRCSISLQIKTKFQIFSLCKASWMVIFWNSFMTSLMADYRWWVVEFCTCRCFELPCT